MAVSLSRKTNSSQSDTHPFMCISPPPLSNSLPFCAKSALPIHPPTHLPGMLWDNSVKPSQDTVCRNNRHQENSKQPYNNDNQWHIHVTMTSLILLPYQHPHTHKHIPILPLPIHTHIHTPPPSSYTSTPLPIHTHTHIQTPLSPSPPHTHTHPHPSLPHKCSWGSWPSWRAQWKGYQWDRGLSFPWYLQYVSEPFIISILQTNPQQAIQW